MSDQRTCLNPACRTEVVIIGVCVSCANGTYNPKTDGAEASGVRTDGVTESSGARLFN